MRILKYITNTPYTDPRQVDFTMIGFRKNTTYSKGRKLVSEYTNGQDVIVRKTFTDIFDQDTNMFIGIHILFEWLDENDSVAVKKEQKVYMDTYEASTYLQKRRERAISQLTFAAQGTPIAPYLKQIFEHYKSEIDEFITIGSSVFADAVTNETDQTINQLLAINVPRADGNGTITVKDSILHAI